MPRSAARVCTLAAARLVLLAYPRRFRDRFAAQVLQSIAADIDEARRAGRSAAALASLEAVRDAARGLLPEHRAERLRRKAGQRQGVSMFRSGLGDDCRQAVRALRQSPGFTFVAVAVLSLAIAAATTIFSVVDAVVLRALPFPESDRIVSVLEHVPGSGRMGTPTTPQTFLEWQAQQRAFERFAAVHRVQFRIRNERDEPDIARGLRVTTDFWPLLHVAPVLGRTTVPDDELPGRDRVVVLTYGFWQARFGGATDVVGRTLQLDDEAWEIVGVLPHDFSWPVASAFAGELFTPVAFRPEERVRARTRNFAYGVIGRLKDGVSIAQATDEMNRIAEGIDRAHPEWNPGGRVQVLTVHEALVGRVRSWMLTLLAAVGLVLLIACANVANLLLVRSTVRGREIGIRAALGASRWRIARALIVESLLLSALATAAGLVLAWGGVRVLTAWLPDGLPRASAIGIDLRVLAASAAAALATGLTFGLVPALQASRGDVTLAFRDGGRTTSGAAAARLRGGLVVAEVALAVVLLVGAGLFIRSFIGLVRVNTGFDHRGVLTVNVNRPFDPGEDWNASLQDGRRYVQQVLEAVAQVPGVLEAGSVSGGLPLGGGWQRDPVRIPGRPDPEGPDREIHTRRVSHNYLQILRVPLVRGRYLTPGDTSGRPPSALVNEAAARHYWPDRDALGARIVIENREMTVVGIVGDIRHGGPESPVNPEAYVPLAQDGVLSAALVIRTAGDPLALLPAVKAAIWTVNPEQRFTSPTYTMDGHMRRLLAQRRFNMLLLTLFGMLGLVIAAAGIYGVMAYVVAQRVPEIGVRMALGATPRRIVRMVLGNAGSLLGIGLAIGFMGARYLSQTVAAFLFGVEPTDPQVFAAAIGTLAASGLLASALPARRAASVDPVVALRRA